MTQKKMKSFKSWVVHRMGGLMREEVPDLMIQQDGNEMRIEEISSMAAFDSPLPLTNKSTNDRVRHDLAKMLGDELLRIGAIEFVEDRMPPYSYVEKARVKVVIPRPDWW